MKKLFIAVILTGLAISNAHSSHECEGTITAMDMSSSGGIYASISGMAHAMKFCTTQGNEGLYSADACKGVQSMLMAAYMSGKKVQLWFNNDANTSCSKGNWSKLYDHGLYHVRIKN